MEADYSVFDTKVMLQCYHSSYPCWRSRI